MSRYPIIACLLVVTASAAPALAEQEPSAATDQAKLEQANRLFGEGNQLLGDLRLARAAEKYRQALELFDHPVIRFNLAKALVGLDKPLEAYREADLALRADKTWMGSDDKTREENYQNIRKLRDELRAQLGSVVFASAPSGSTVTVGNDDVDISKSEPKILLPGSHEVEIEARRHRSFTQIIQLRAGEDLTLTLRSQRRMARWKPWAVLGGGVVLTALGGFLYFDARSSRDDLRSQTLADCSTVECRDDTASALTSEWTTIQVEAWLGRGSLVVGTAGVLAGITLLYLNSQRSFTMTATRTKLSITPVISPELTGIVTGASF